MCPCSRLSRQLTQPPHLCGCLVTGAPPLPTPGPHSSPTQLRDIRRIIIGGQQAVGRRQLPHFGGKQLDELGGGPAREWVALQRKERGAQLEVLEPTGAPCLHLRLRERPHLARGHEDQLQFVPIAQPLEGGAVAIWVAERGCQLAVHVPEGALIPRLELSCARTPGGGWRARLGPPLPGRLRPHPLGLLRPQLARPVDQLAHLDDKHLGHASQ
eukprot:scaffold6944_cov118-Isochrysis_galbana.AAC.2